MLVFHMHKATRSSDAFAAMYPYHLFLFLGSSICTAFEGFVT